ncbi:histidine phosphatase family protein [Pseudonocardia sp.]|uniref:histidine phosphatase family protein n=1 Tax=Pseudonocardia sp. TaxID=60912 RepID=UPI003D0CAD4F
MTAYEVVLLRHGETPGYDGDHGLTERGERQARDRGAALAAELKPGTTVRMPHARTARGTATAVTLRAALLEALGEDHAVEVGPLYPEPWFDNLRFALHGEGVDASVAVTERLTLNGALPDWAREYDRFDTDFGESSRAGGPIGYWLRRPTLWFEPPHLGAHRMWRGIVEVGRDAPEGLVVLVSTHSAPMRAFAATAIGDDPGEPANLEEIRVSVHPDGAATVRFRGHAVGFEGPPELPPWIDRAWLESFGR